MNQPNVPNEKTPLAVLRELASELGIKSVSKYKKAELLEIVLTRINSGTANASKKSDPQSEDKAADAPKAENKPKSQRRTKATKQTQKSDAPEKIDKLPEEADESASAEEGTAQDQVSKSTEAAPEPEAGRNPTGEASGILEVLPEGYGFLRGDNYLTTPDDVYVSPVQIRRFNLKTGDYLYGVTRKGGENDRFDALIYVKTVNGDTVDKALHRKNFDQLTPVYPDSRIRLECEGCDCSVRLIDLLAPVGKGQRGMLVAPPKAGKTTLLKSIANSISANNPEVNLIVLLIDERPEEVTDMKRSIDGEVIYSTFDELPEHHIKVAEMVLERAQRLVEHGKDVVILLDSITRLARAYNLTIPSSGKILSGGIDPGALHKPKKFFGAARNIENGGSLTILATALIETGSRMDDVIYEEFKGTGNMEVHLDRKLSERRIFPAIDIYKSGTRKDELILTPKERDAAWNIRRSLSSSQGAEVAENVISSIVRTRTNDEFISKMKIKKIEK